MENKAQSALISDNQAQTPHPVAWFEFREFDSRSSISITGYERIANKEIQALMTSHGDDGRVSEREKDDTANVSKAGLSSATPPSGNLRRAFMGPGYDVQPTWEWLNISSSLRYLDFGNISKSHASPEVYLPMQAWVLAWKLLDQDAASRNETSTVQKQQTRQRPIALINCHSIRLWLCFHTASSLKNVPPEKAGRA
ncbi:hypothetical protein I7I51_07817 [Histoplasma capsulatum]|uniref:Uncharacterized protein n=1 Tax=Ajellomyces capsulatus TaxID=5037 RepID=A0A8A1LX84_AJECA|nr:hypothetical protein I7I51_07817 [Histoplasma capsulatum]